MNGIVKGNQLILTIDLATTPFQSKSALDKARKECDKAKVPFDATKVAATMLATSGGFARVGDLKVSFNVTKG
jgi:hypothetical protein